MPEFQTFFTPERLDDFWYYVKWFMFLIGPIVMIFFGVDIVSLFIKVIRKAIGYENKKDDDDDYDIYRY